MSDSTKSIQRQAVSERFCTMMDSDVTFESADKVLFHIHPKYLEATIGFQMLNETVPLAENAATLELLFQFVYPARHPDLEALEFGDLTTFAEAAEKYEVYAAMNTCKSRMKQTLPAHWEVIIKYAANHGYMDIIAKAAPWMIKNKPLEDIVALMPPHLVLPFGITANRLTPWDCKLCNILILVLTTLLTAGASWFKMFVLAVRTGVLSPPQSYRNWYELELQL